jgi:hypothetical protein
MYKKNTLCIAGDDSRVRRRPSDHRRGARAACRIEARASSLFTKVRVETTICGTNVLYRISGGASREAEKLHVAPATVPKTVVALLTARPPHFTDPKAALSMDASTAMMVSRWRLRLGQGYEEDVHNVVVLFPFVIV